MHIMAAHGPHGARWPIPTRVLVVLALLVLLAHALALRNVALRLEAAPTLATRAFTTRSITLAPPPAPPPVLPRRPVTPRPPAPVMPKPPPPPPGEGVLTAAARPAESMPPPAVEPEQEATPEPPAAPASEAPATPVAAEPDPEPVPAQAEPVEATAQATGAEPVPGAATLFGRLPGTAAPLANETGQSSRPYVIPGSIRLNFDAVGKRGRLDYKAMGTLIWLQDGSSYDMKLEMGDWIIGKRVLSSTGRLGMEGLAPTRFSDKFRTERAAHFDRSQQRITFSANTPQATLAPGAQDQLSIFAQLASMVAGDPLGFPIGTTVTMQTAGPRDAETWVFEVEREEMLYLPGGHVPALKLVRKPGRNYDQTVELWLAPELAYLPARIRIALTNGDFIDQQWRSSAPP